MTTWKKRVLGALVLAFGMATTIATSAVEFELPGESQELEREAGQPTSVVGLIDAQTMDEGWASFRYEVTVTSPEPFGELRVVTNGAEDDAAAAGPMTWESYETESGEYEAVARSWSDPFDCYDGEWCSQIVTFETDTAVPYTVTVTGSAVKGSEFREDARFVLDVE